MNSAERLRTRLMVAAQKFANEIADAVLEATGTRDEVSTVEERPRRRRPHREQPAIPAELVEPRAAVRAEAALARLGIRKSA